MPNDMNGNMNADGLLSYITALGQIAAAKKPKNVAPGGIQGSVPAPLKIRSDNGITDSDFVRQIIAAAQAQSGPMQAMDMGNNSGMPQNMGTQQGSGPSMDGMASMMQALGAGGGGKQ